MISDTSVYELTLKEEEELILLCNSQDLISKHSEDESVNSFWINLRFDYLTTLKKSLSVLLQLSTPYLCEFGFSALTNIKKEERSRLLNLDQE